MSPIALSMNLFLALLLIAALMVGVSLNRRLKALRDGQLGFAKAVADLDRAAARAHAGLAELREATDEALELLGGRIEKARELSAKLDGAISKGAEINITPAHPREGGDPVLSRSHGDRWTDLGPRLRGDERNFEEAPLRLRPLPSLRSRAKIDDDLFDMPLSGAGR